MKLEILFLLIINCIQAIRIKQMPVPDSQWRQANVPPMIAVMFDVPAYGKSGLYDWDDIVRSNVKLIEDNRQNNREINKDLFENKLNQINQIEEALSKEPILENDDWYVKNNKRMNRMGRNDPEPTKNTNVVKQDYNEYVRNNKRMNSLGK
jgi:hypothetical protein